jgi:hypothetical protein
VISSPVSGNRAVTGVRVAWFRQMLWTPVLLYMAMLFGLSSWSAPPSLPGGSDKAAHWLLYSGLSVLVVRALARGEWRAVTAWRAIVAVAICAAYGLSDECHQAFVPGRDAELLDLAADTFGASAAAATLWLWGTMKRPKADA